MQQADYQCQRPTPLNAKKCVPAQKPNPCQVFEHESSKVGGRGKGEEEKKQPKKKKNYLPEELKLDLPSYSSG